MFAVMMVVTTMVVIPLWMFGQEKLDAMVAYSLKKIPPRLEKAEKLAEKGNLPNAKVSLEEAQKVWDMIHKDFKEKFDENHPDIVAVRKQLKTVKAKVAGAAKTVKKDTATPVKKGEPATTDPLPSTMVYEMKQIGSTLDKAEKYIAADEPHEARRVFDSAHLQWKTKKGWNKGKFNPQHPEVVALEDRFAKVKEKVEQLEKKEDAAGK
jgi:hypothetical protein